MFTFTVPFFHEKNVKMNQRIVKTFLKNRIQTTNPFEKEVSFTPYGQSVFRKAVSFCWYSKRICISKISTIKVRGIKVLEEISFRWKNRKSSRSFKFQVPPNFAGGALSTRLVCGEAPSSVWRDNLASIGKHPKLWREALSSGGSTIGSGKRYPRVKKHCRLWGKAPSCGEAHKVLGVGTLVWGAPSSGGHSRFRLGKAPSSVGEQPWFWEKTLSSAGKHLLVVGEAPSSVGKHPWLWAEATLSVG